VKFSAKSVAVLCYVLSLAAWGIDMVTPQLFVTAILLNGPIALSALALNARLTVSLIIFAQIVNIVAAYFNGAHDGYVWSGIAIGDRILTAASFLLVGFLTIRSQEFARTAGQSQERLRQAEEERKLRRASELVRATLNIDVVRRAIVREVLSLIEADEAIFIMHKTMQLPETYAYRRGAVDVTLDRRALDPSTTSLLARLNVRENVLQSSAGDAVTGIFLETHAARTMIASGIAFPGSDGMLFVLRSVQSVEPYAGLPFLPSDERQLRAFADIAEIALEQADLFARIRRQNDEITEFREVLQAAVTSNDALRKLVETRLPEEIPPALSNGAALDRLPRTRAILEQGTTPLTSRETEILHLVAEGVGNAEIAERLHLGLGTVKGHVRDILEKLGAADRTQAAVVALRQGYI